MESYDRLEFEARPGVVRGFAAGWAAGQGWTREEMAHRFLWPQEWNIQVESRFQEMVGNILPENDCVVLLRRDSTASFFTALAPWERKLEVTLRAHERVESASLSFSFEFFDREEARQVRSIFENLPQGVRMSDDYRPEEHTDASAAGAEMYAPVHEYSFAAEGTIRGDLRGVLQVSERAHQHERIKRKAVQLHLGT